MFGQNYVNHLCEVIAMNKINGYTEEEATGLIEYIYTGKNAGKTLSYLFETYGRAHNRAKGSVRNYYYSFLKRTDDARVRKILDSDATRRYVVVSAPGKRFSGDAKVTDLAKVVGFGINLALQTGLTVEDVELFLS